jgi:hypothetical protein
MPHEDEGDEHSSDGDQGRTQTRERRRIYRGAPTKQRDDDARRDPFTEVADGDSPLEPTVRRGNAFCGERH